MELRSTHLSLTTASTSRTAKRAFSSPLGIRSSRSRHEISWVQLSWVHDGPFGYRGIDGGSRTGMGRSEDRRGSVFALDAGVAAGQSCAGLFAQRVLQQAKRAA